MTQQITIPLATLEQLVGALEGVEALIEHQYTGTFEAMNALQNASDDAQEALTSGRAAIDGAQRVGSTVKDCLTVPTNPNNCQYCEHSKNPQGGHCYMFRKAPTDICAKHTLANVSRGIGA